MPQIHINNTNHILYILTGSLLFLTSGFLVLSFLSPFAVDNSYAQSTNVDVSVGIAPVISISTDVNSVNLDVKPNDFGSIVSGDVSVNVGTNNASGYTLSLSSSNSETALLKDGTNTNISIPTLESPTTKSTWQASDNLNNKWGFTHDNTSLLTTDTYLPIPASNHSHDTTIKTTTTPATTSNTKVTFATKIDNTQPAGNYTNTVIFSAIANIIPNTYMQDFTAAQCKLLPTWQSSSDDITLIDSRDNNSYVIRKLKDGNCWMAQNLRLTGPRLLTPEDSDVTSNFNLETSATWTDTIVTTPHHASALDAPVGSISGDKATGDLAYARGAYYNWAATVADASETETGVSKTTSLCPKGWDLPTNDGSRTNTNQFWNIYNKYSNYTNLMNAYDYYYSNGYSKDYYLPGQQIAHGYIDSSSTAAFWWSNTSHSSNTNKAWFAVANSNGGFGATDDGAFKFNGFSVRCVLSSE